MPLLLISSAPLLLKTLFCITAQATYLCGSHFEVFCQHEPIMKLKVSKRPGIRWVSTAHWKGRGQECLIPSQAFRCASWAVRIPVWEQRCCRASVDPSFTARHNMPVSVTFRVLETLLKSENSKSQILGFFWDRLVFFLAILVNPTYIHAHACLCRRTDIFPEHEIQKREQRHGFFPLSCHCLTKKKRTS